MKLEEAFQKFRPIPRKVLRRLAADGIVAFPLSEADRKVIEALSRIWTSEWYVAQMNKSFGLDKRAAMLAFPNFGRIDRYVLSTYLNLQPQEKISVRKMASRVRKFFRMEYPEDDIKRIRQIAYNLRRESRTAARKQIVILLAMLQEANTDDGEKRLSNFSDIQTFPPKDEIEKFVIGRNPARPRRPGGNSANR